MIISIPNSYGWESNNIDDFDMLLAHMAISAIQAGHWPREIIIGFA
jgi:hypothetical protein